MISPLQKESRTPNQMIKKDLFNQLQNKQSQESNREDTQSSSQSIRNTPSHRRIIYERQDRQKPEIQCTPLQTPDTSNRKEQHNKSQISHVLPQITEQNNFLKKNQQNHQYIQQQPQHSQHNQPSNYFKTQQIQYQQQQQSNLQSQPQKTPKFFQKQKQQQQQQDKQQQNQININLKQKSATTQQLNQFINVINSISGGEVNIQIKINSKLNQQQLQELQRIIEIYPEQIQQKKKIYQGQNKLIIQVEPQTENNVSQQLKIIIFQWKCMKALLLEADNYQIDIDIDIKKCLYTLISKKQSKQQTLIRKFYGLFEEKLQNFIILTHKCQSEEEAIQKLKLFQKIEIKKIIAKELEIDSLRLIDIDLISKYPLKDKSLKDIVKSYFKENILIVALMDYDTQFHEISIQQLQNKLNQFLQNSIILHQYTQIYHVENKIDIEQIKYQIQSINTDKINVQIGIPIIDYEKEIYSYQFTYNTWKFRYDFFVVDKRLYDFQRKIENFINRIMDYEIQGQEQIKIWNLYLEHQFNYRQINVYKGNEYIFIKFMAEKQQNIKNSKEIRVKLQDLKYSQIKFRLDQSILGVLKQYEIKKVFVSELEYLKANQQYAYLQAFNIDEQQQMIIFEAIYQGYLIESVNEQLYTNIINQINIQRVDINFNQIFEHQQQSKEKYEQIHKCYIQIWTNQTTYVTLKENVRKIKKSIEEYKQFICMKTIVRKKLKQKLSFEEIQLIIKANNSYNQQLSILFSEDDNMIEFKGPQNIVNDGIKQLEKLFEIAQQ